MEFNTSTQHLRREVDGSFSLHSQTRALCRSCALHPSCELYAALTDEQHINNCHLFTPVLVFSPKVAVNLDLPMYNTLRTGKAWFHRLVMGQRVGVYDRKRDRLMMAKVRATFWDKDKSLMLERHAKNNHFGMTLDRPAEQMVQIMQRLGGKGFYEKAFGLTAIYLHLQRD